MMIKETHIVQLFLDGRGDFVDGGDCTASFSTDLLQWIGKWFML